MTSNVVPADDDLVERARTFLNRAFRNIDLPPLSEDDMRDIGEALSSELARCRNALEDLDDEISALNAAHEAMQSINENNEAYELHLKLEGLEAARAIFAKHAALNPIEEKSNEADS